MPRFQELGPWDPIFDGDTVYGSIAVGNTPGVELVTVTINQAAGQDDPADGGEVQFTVVFSEPVTGFAIGDVTLSGTAGATTTIIENSGDDTTFNVRVSGMNNTGTVIATIPSGVVTSIATGAPNATSTSTDNVVTWNKYPYPIITRQVGQTDPARYAPLLFDILWSESVSGFVSGDVTFTGSTTGGTIAGAVVDSGDHIHFTLSVAGMEHAGDVTVVIADSVATATVGGNPSAAAIPITVEYACQDVDPFDDPFDRPDRVNTIDALGPCWDQTRTQSGTNLFWGVASSQMQYVGASATSRVSRIGVPTLDFAGPDFVVEFDVVALVGTNLILQARARADSTVASDYYYFQMRNVGFGGPDLEIRIGKVVGGVGTDLDGPDTLTNLGSAGATPLIAERFRFSVVGTTISLDTMPIGGGSVTNRLSATDSAISSGDLCGFTASSGSNSNPQLLDNVEIS